MRLVADVVPSVLTSGCAFRANNFQLSKLSLHAPLQRFELRPSQHQASNYQLGFLDQFCPVLPCDRMTEPRFTTRAPGRTSRAGTTATATARSRFGSRREMHRCCHVGRFHSNQRSSSGTIASVLKHDLSR